jgi:uncharacterized coiled-coil DUF342 family protein
MSLSPEEIEYVQARITAIVAKSSASVMSKIDDFFPILRELAERVTKLEAQAQHYDTVLTDHVQRIHELEEIIRTNYDSDRNGS